MICLIYPCSFNSIHTSTEIPTLLLCYRDICPLPYVLVWICAYSLIYLRTVSTSITPYPLPHAATLLPSAPFLLYTCPVLFIIFPLSVSICLAFISRDMWPPFPLLLSYPSYTFLSSSYTFFVLLLRKLPWLSRQSDRLLTDRSLVRSQAEAPFCFFLSLPPIYKIDKKVRLPWVSTPRPRG